MMVTQTYIQSMGRSTPSRLAALLLATLVGFAAPGLALAHAYAHQEAQEHGRNGREHHHGKSAGPTVGSATQATPSFETPGGSGRHPHPELSPALSARANLSLFVMPSAVTLPEYLAVVNRASLRLKADPPRAGSPDALLRQPRAPPQG